VGLGSGATPQLCISGEDYRLWNVRRPLVSHPSPSVGPHRNIDPCDERGAVAQGGRGARCRCWSQGLACVRSMCETLIPDMPQACLQMPSLRCCVTSVGAEMHSWISQADHRDELRSGTGPPRHTCVPWYSLGIFEPRRRPSSVAASLGCAWFCAFRGANWRWCC
jgi:hypothetical protein